MVVTEVIEYVHNGIDNKEILFYCPGCKMSHSVRVKGKEPVWGWNGSLDKPTFTPSILVRVIHENEEKLRCHSYVTDGNIQYLSDCKHNLKDQTIPLEDFKYYGDENENTNT